MADELDEIPEAPTLTLERIEMPDNTLNVHFDVNQYLEDHTEEQLWAFLGKLRDTFRPVPASPW